MNAPAAAEQPAELAGLLLEQLAVVQVASVEGFELDEVLATEELDREPFEEAERKWRVRLASDEELFHEYSRLLRVHEDRLYRRVMPLDHDLEA
jgi:hypothetical protein